MLSVGFEPTVPARARPQTYALDRAATETGNRQLSHGSKQQNVFLQEKKHQKIKVLIWVSATCSR